MTTSKVHSEGSAADVPASEPSASTATSDAPRVRSGRFTRVPGFGVPTARFVWLWSIALLVANVGIVATGGAVRLTGSGLGCPTWPRCTDDSFVPHGELGLHGVIEFGNRMLTWVLVAVAIATFTAVYRYAHATRRDRWLAALLGLGIPFQGVIGGITVLTQLNPWVVSLHFVLSMVLVSGATVLVHRLRPQPATAPAADLVSRLGQRLAWLQYVVTWAVIYLGTVVTGSGPHAGDADAPRNGLAPDNATQLHADGVFVLVGLAVALAVVTHLMRQPERRTADVALALIAVQGVLGVVQYNTGLPIALVIAHMTVSALLLIAATWMILQFGDRRRPVTTGPMTTGPMTSGPAGAAPMDDDTEVSATAGTLRTDRRPSAG
ncbi:heme A synthase [Gordonia sp. HNM0687]|uniref:Heme A synthase n=1 Tax=Gordonia mangrovi TaxID=2665643 RepID=A0A6L7GUJ5_9ACTN|nr:COX15/CtaA family protein [Gordonia mangrovi]MXP22208.1 heme A synthase [Gordonia mangrovi]UVF77887.1 COX15/CtaA family protein [Gordonia mangrovi]